MGRAPLVCLALVVGGLVVGAAFASGPIKRLTPRDEALAYRMSFHLRDMPVGWRTEKDDSSSAKCATTEPPGYVVTGKADSAFSSGDVDRAATLAVVLRAPAGSKRVYRLLYKGLPGCLLEAMKHGGEDASVGAMSFPRLGHQSVAWRAQATVTRGSVSVRFYFDTEIVRKARAVAVYLFGGLLPANTVQEIRLVRKAVARG